MVGHEARKRRDFTRHKANEAMAHDGVIYGTRRNLFLLDGFVVAAATLALVSSALGVKLVLDGVGRTTGHETREHGPLVANHLLNLNEVVFFKLGPRTSR